VALRDEWQVSIYCLIYCTRSVLVGTLGAIVATVGH
jgi:hypothetical protein